MIKFFYDLIYGKGRHIHNWNHGRTVTAAEAGRPPWLPSVNTEHCECGMTRITRGDFRVILKAESWNLPVNESHIFESLSGPADPSGLWK